jgi:hypothetical protein
VKEQQNYTNNEDALDEKVKNIKASNDHLLDYFNEARTSYDYYAGKQWDQKDVEKLEKEKRQAVTFNRIPRTINAVCGLEIQNRQEARILPREKSDGALSELSNAAIKWVRDNCDAEDEDSQVFLDELITGYGWSEIKMDYESDPEGEIVINRVDPLQMRYDPCARKKNLVDAKWLCHQSQMSLEDVQKRWPEADLSNAVTSIDSTETTPVDSEKAKQYESNQAASNKSNKMLVVSRYQWYESEPLFEVLNPQTGSTEYIDQGTFQKLELDTLNIPYVKKTKRCYYQQHLLGRTELEPPAKLTCDHFTYICSTGLYDRNKNTFFGLVKLMIDPQMWANKWLSQILHIINSNAKGGIIYETGTFRNNQTVTDKWAEPSGLVEVNPGGLDKIRERIPPQYPQGLDKLLQYAMSGVNEVSGVSLEFLGMTDRDQSGVLEAQRLHQGTLILAPFFDSLRRYRKNQGRLIFKFIQEYIADGRLMRVVGEQGAQYLPLIKDQLAFKYDIVVDDAPTSPNVKERVFAAVMQMVPICLESGIPIPPGILDYAPLPESLIQEWKQQMQPNPEDQMMQQQIKQLQLVMQQLEAAYLQAKTFKESQLGKKVDSEIAKNIGQAQQAAAIGQDEQAQAQQKLGLASQEHEMKNIEIMLDNARKDFESIMNQRRKTEEAKANIQIKAMQARQAKTQRTSANA